MSTPQDGGPAFPTVSANVHLPHHGMSLRDWFAGMALQGWLASYDPQSRHPAHEEAALGLALSSYDIADAMLAARGGKEDA